MDLITPLCRTEGRHPFLLALLLVVAWAVLPQGVWAQRGCDEPELGLAARDRGCLICPDNPTIASFTLGYTPSEPLFPWCTTIENDQWYSVYPDRGGLIQVRVSTEDCLTGEGIQAAVFEGDPMSPTKVGALVSNCLGNITAMNSATLTAFGLDPSRPYLLRVDGNAGAECEFQLEFSKLGNGSWTSVEYNDAQTTITYFDSPCEQTTDTTTTQIDSCFYSVNYSVNPVTAGTASTVWRTTEFGTRALDLVIDWAPPAPLRATVDANFSLVRSIGNATCSSSFRREVFSHFLDQSNAYLKSDTILGCGTQRQVFLLAPNARVVLALAEAGTQRYVVAGAGLPGTYFAYQFDQAGRRHAGGAATTSRFADTVAVDFSRGVVTLVIENPNRYPTEFLLERLEPYDGPYRFAQACTADTFSICAGENSARVRCGILNPRLPPSARAVCNGISVLENVRITDAGGGSAPGITASAAPSSWGVNWDLTIDQAAPPAPGIYMLHATARLPAGCATLACIDTAAVELAVLVSIVPVDTVRLAPVVLDASTGRGRLFVDVDGVSPLFVSAPGTYQRLSSTCTLYIQRALTSAPAVDLGEMMLCPGACATAPTGETFACGPGPDSLLASNDTLYRVRVTVDSATAIAVRLSVYRCDSTTGQWTLDLTWTGSRGPYTVNGVTTAGMSMQLGPFSDPSVPVEITGSSACVGALTFDATYACSLVGAAEVARALGIALEPNPSRELRVRVSGGAAGPWALVVYDALGRAVLQGTADAGVTTYADSRALPAGSYRVELRQGDTRAALSWVKPQ